MIYVATWILKERESQPHQYTCVHITPAQFQCLCICDRIFFLLSVARNRFDQTNDENHGIRAKAKRRRHRVNKKVKYFSLFFLYSNKSSSSLPYCVSQHNFQLPGTLHWNVGLKRATHISRKFPRLPHPRTDDCAFARGSQIWNDWAHIQLNYCIC
jgi:hypothetical protein